MSADAVSVALLALGSVVFGLAPVAHLLWLDRRGRVRPFKGR